MLITNPLGPGPELCLSANRIVAKVTCFATLLGSFYVAMPSLNCVLIIVTLKSSLKVLLCWDV